jgi:hypothetical protein
MDNKTENNGNYLTGRKGKITALIFLLLMLAPILYAFIKEYKLSKQAKRQTLQTANKQP